MWQKLDMDWIRKEVGQASLSFLSWQFTPHLFSEEFKFKPDRFRMAPSIIARSECEVLALSAPRFAIRYTFENGSFVNLRRVEQIAKWAEDRPWTRPSIEPTSPYEYKELAKTGMTPADVFRASSARSIAEGMIVPPPQLTTNFYVTTTQLHTAFGETERPAEPEPAGVPFLQSIMLGGGLCAQAVCFMATCIHHQQVKGIHGLGEISAIVGDCLDAISDMVIPLGGLNSRDMCKYLNSAEVGLSARMLVSESAGVLKTTPEDNSWVEFRATQVALAAYLKSGIPVILTADANKLPPHNSPSSPPVEPSQPQRRHAMLAVGVHKTNQDQILVNDPSLLPLMLYSYQQLFDARPKASSGMRFIPVAPAQVKLHLLDSTLGDDPMELNAHVQRTSKNDEYRVGLVKLFAKLVKLQSRESETVVARCFARSQGKVAMLGRLLLVCFEDSNWYELVQASLGAHVSQLLSATDSSCLRSWRWIQVRATENGDAVIVWDACTEAKLSNVYNNSCLNFVRAAWFRPRGTQQWQAYLPGSESKNSRRESTTTDSLEEERDEASKATSSDEAVALIPSIISSFVCEPLRRSGRIFKHHLGDGRITHLDVYALMQTEALPRSLDVTAESALAMIHDDKQAIEAIAKIVTKALARAGCQPAAVATFFPSISFPTDSPLAEQSRQAIQTSCQLAGMLQSQYRRSVPVEIVGGTRVLGVYPGYNNLNPEDVMLAHVVGWQRSIEYLVDNLKLVAKSLQGLNGNMPRALIELEPGPLFTINKERSLLELTRRIDDEPLLRSWIGLNLDVCHYRLSHIEPDFVREHEAVRNKIWHAHISGHHRCAHFGDLPPLDLNDPRDFAEWLELLRELKLQGNYSGMIALELEATRSPATLRRAVEQFLQVLE